MNINLWHDETMYDVNKMTHVTLNAELFRLYDCGYFTDEEFIDYVNYTIKRYEKGISNVKELVYETRKMRLEYLKIKK